jgi:hypothetical protein
VVDDERDGEFGECDPGPLRYLGQFLNDVELAWLAGLVMSNRALGRALEAGLDAESFRHRPESQPPASGL